MITPVGEQKTVMRAFADWQIYERNRDLYHRKWDAWHTVEGPAVVFRDIDVCPDLRLELGAADRG